MITKKFNIFLMTTTLIALSGINESKASLLQLTHDPLFLTQSVPPAIAVTFDDSGSMAWAWMGPNGDPEFADPTQNRLYYNPSIIYAPPLRADGSEMPDASFTAAWVDGFNQGEGTVNLSQDYIPLSQISYRTDRNNTWFAFRRFSGMPGIDDADIDDFFYDPYPTATIVANDWGVPAFYLTPDGAGGYTTNTIPASQQQNFANWYAYYNSRMKLARTAVSRAFSTFGPNFKLGWQEINSFNFFSALNKFELGHRNDFYDWLFDIPTSGGTPLRSAFERAGEEFTDVDNYFSTDFNQTISCQQNFHIAISDGEWNGDGNFNNEANWAAPNLHDENSTTIPGDSDGLLTAYNPGAGEQEIYPEEDNLTSLSDITFSYWARDLVNLENNVKRYKNDYTDASGNTITYTTNQEWVEPAFQWNPSNDPAYWQHMVTYNVGLGLEASLVENHQSGNFTAPNCPDNGIADSRESVLLSLRNGSCEWPDGSRVDDVWHSSINSRGDFLSANDPDELVAALNAVVNNILERLSRGSASTVSSGVVTDSTTAYSPAFDSSNWSGSLIARRVRADRSFGTPLFDLSCTLTDIGTCPATGNIEPYQNPSQRNVYTYDSGSDTKVAFAAGSPGQAMTEFAANVAVDHGTTVSLTEAVDYIKGVQDNEVSRTGLLRDRTTVLADIVHASPVVVRGPSANYLDSFWPTDTPEHAASFDADGNPDGYLSFKEDEIDRKNMVYVGGNSGMLHAVSAEGNGAESGRELWSYIPSRAMRNLHELLNPAYEHKSFVDNTPVVTDAFINGSWRSILVSGMRYGGQAFFAIDVTNANATEPDVLWEFTDENDVDMGYSYGQAQIVRITSTKEWVALIPNGYNNSEPDFTDPADPRNRVSSTGTAVLYVVRLSDGQLLAKIDTGVGSAATPNGLATPVGVDSQYIAPSAANLANSNIDIGTDFVYAGDLYGNLWRFDFTSPNYSDWQNSTNIRRVLEADGIMEQPITVQPKILSTSTPNASHDVIVMAATGKYIEIPDRSINLPNDQFLFAIYDGPSSTDSEDLSLNNGDLIEQSFTSAGGANIRRVSNVDFDPVVEKGWKLELPAEGERVANPLSLIGNDVLLATSTITAGDDPCEAGGQSWLIAINPETGGTLEVDSDGLFEVFELDASGNPTTTVLEGDAIAISDLIIGKPPILESLGGGDVSIVVEGAESTQTITLEQFTWRRRNFTNLLTE